MKKLVALLTTAIMVVAFAMPAMAANNYDTDTGLTHADGGVATFNKYLTMEAGTMAPDLEFTYSIAPGTAVPAAAATQENPATAEIYAGVGTPVMGDASSQNATAEFDYSSTVYTTVQGTDGVSLGAGKQYAKDTVSVNFSSVDFPEPGIYRYVLTETSSGQAGVTYDTQAATAGSKVRYMDVYVTDNGSGVLGVSDYILHETTDAPTVGTNNGTAEAGAASTSQVLADKSDGFVNDYDTIDLEFKKEVDGNQASRDKYFEFTVKLTAGGPSDSDTFNVVLTNATSAAITAGTTNAATNVSGTNPATVTGAQLKSANGVKFYLQHGEFIRIMGLPAGATYSVTENAEEYKSAAADVTGYKNAITGVLSTKDALDDADGATAVSRDNLVKTSFKNTKAGVIPTGVAMGISGAAILLAIAAVYFFMRRRSAAYED